MPRTYNQCDQYIKELFTIEDKLLNDITNNLSPQAQAMQVSPNEGKLIYLLLKIINAKSVIEIGTLAGYSATWIARALGESGKLYCFEKDEAAIDIFKKQLIGTDIENNIIFKSGDARQNLENFNESVDAFFIDADKSSYPLYLEHAKRLLRDGGLLIADNVLLYGNVYDQPTKVVSQKTRDAILEFNKSIASSQEFESTIIPTSEGLLIARKMAIKE